MSSNPPARRSTRAIPRPLGADENAARATRPLRSTKMATAATANSNQAPLEKAHATNTLASARAELAAKRKREALGEVTNKNKARANAAAGGSKAEKDTQLVKKPAPSTLTVTASTERARVVPTRKTRSSTAAEKEEDVEDEHAMAVDTEQPPAPRGLRRVSAARTTFTTTASRRIETTTTGSTRRVSVAAASASTAASRARLAAPTRRVLGSTQTRTSRIAAPPAEDEVKPAHKKRRTSSIGPDDRVTDDGEEEAKFAAPEEQLEVAPVEVIEQDLGLSSLEGEVKWDDLDKEDEGDPQMVSEYVAEIFQYLLDVELTTMPNPRYMDTQKDLAWKMRGILTDWLIQIHQRFRLLPETLFLCINIIDRFLSARFVSLVKLQLVGVTALFIAAKYEEIMAPSVANFLSSADGNYDEKDILEAEKYILRTLDWNLSYPNPIHFLRRASKADGYDLASRTVAKYFIEISLLEHRMLEAPPSLVAAAGIWLARLVLDKEEWTPNLAHYSYYSEAEILPVARLMLNYLLKPTKHENFFKKYAARKFMKASPFVHQWVRDRWPEGTNVDLEDELPELRRAAEARRLAGTAAGQLAEEDGTLVVPR